MRFGSAERGEAIGAATTWVAELFSRDWGTKLSALLVSLLVFMVTRDDVQRTFSVPIRAVADPHRLLLTELPESATVEVRGPWAKISGLRSHEIGDLLLNLRQAVPGPLTLDSAAVVMPPGIILERLDYDRVDLRFDTVIERQLPIVAPVVGEVHADYELAGVTVVPSRWGVRGGEQSLADLRELTTERVNLAGATQTRDLSVELVRVDGAARFVGTVGGRPPTVRVQVVVRPRSGEREVTVPLGETWAALLGEDLSSYLSVLEPSRTVAIRGPVPALARLQAVERPVVARVFAPPQRDGKLTLRFEWAGAVPLDLVRALTLVPVELRIEDPRRRDDSAR
ncbi:MAG: YbbR-like domain-containing protein [Nannocystaceae bacterium]